MNRRGFIRSLNVAAAGWLAGATVVREAAAAAMGSARGRGPRWHLPEGVVMLAAAVLLVYSAARAHDFAEAPGLPAPPPPPTIDPGSGAALLRVHIIDAVSGRTASATVCINDGRQEPDEDPYREFSLRRSANRMIGTIRHRRIPYYFYTDGNFEVRVPPGTATLEIRKGYEYRPVRREFVLAERETRDLTIGLERAIDMAALGWYSGDTHIHMERTGSNDDILLAVTSAKDVRYAYLLSMNTNGYDPAGVQQERFRQMTGLGDATVARAGIYYISSGQEYRTFRRGQLGHVTIAVPDGYVPAAGPSDDTNKGPSLALIADQAHELRGFIGLAHGGGDATEAPRLLLEGKMDYLELLQFGDYRGIGLEGWYDFLNLGHRLPIVGASDFPPTRELSSEMSYAWSDTVPTARSFVKALAEGRSFATSGPMLFLTVAGKKPGETIHLPVGATTELPVEIRVFSEQYPVRHLELIVNGAVVARQDDEKGRTHWALRHTLPFDGTAWIAARAHGEAGTDAHTNPIYVVAGDRPPFNPESARRILARLDASIATVSVPEVVERMRNLRRDLFNRLAP